MNVEMVMQELEALGKERTKSAMNNFLSTVGISYLPLHEKIRGCKTTSACFATSYPKLDSSTN